MNTEYKQVLLDDIQDIERELLSKNCDAALDILSVLRLRIENLNNEIN